MGGSEPEIDYRAVFHALPGAVMVMTPDLVVIEVNEAFARMTGREREELLGRSLFELFPDNPSDPAATGVRNLEASLSRVVDTAEPDSMALQRYDVEIPGRPGVFEERYWSPVNVPVLDADGKVALIVQRVEEVTELIRRRDSLGGEPADRRQVLEADLYSRARELQAVNERLRQAHAREREVALTLQEAMLPPPRPVGHRPVAVRYRPAVGALNVCGDWYELVELTDEGDRVAVAVGDVVGHGLSAACVMGQLRSALSAAVRAADGPARALDVLGLYARWVPGAESATAVQTVIDSPAHTITYSSAGHPPPVLLQPDGTVHFLDRATDPPLGARPEPVPQPQATIGFDDGATLVLYTDGLVERRTEDIDTGLDRLATALARHARLDPETLADTLLAELSPRGGPTDDTALVILRL
ncbi:PP2C family protein-serine/threonine phosphatase [Streptomyces sp. NBC_01262]|uniref:PP2C family protein-serine/threonine phosphatase n=1 Tax=Streptomyces sp. NBC_01262 TaxID=2903803 RepID=UPI002E356327|nr:SpoIIE family protein phosphatase [Streptomyces sp. NBC_01262]